mmetsp:Transcript_5741/g.12088  ORF Transcript_5741/g.12088 Transcript_5741/m.12088 type:complete len:243 (+) Transcript_5741:201-929(+)
MEVLELISNNWRQLREQPLRNQQRAHVTQIKEHLERVHRTSQVREPKASSRPELHPNHLVHHLRVPVPPLVHRVIDINQRAQQPRGEMQHRLVLVQHDKQRRARRSESQSPRAFLTQLFMHLSPKHRIVHVLRLPQLGLTLPQLIATHLRFNHRAVELHHAVRRLAVAFLEIVPAELAERDVAQPPLDIVEQRRLVERFLNGSTVLWAQRRHKSVGVLAWALHAKLDLDEAELEALEAACWE